MAVASSPVNKPSPIKNTFLILALGFIGLIVVKTLSTGSQHEKSAAHSHALVECYRAEMMMRTLDAMSYLPQSQLFIRTDSQEKASETYSALELQAKGLLKKAAKAEPDDAVILSKKIILESKTKDDITLDLSRLDSIIVAKAEKDVSPKNKELALTIQSIYGRQTSDERGSRIPLPKDGVQLIDKDLSDGWFKEQALLHAYKLNHRIKEQEDLQSLIQSRTWSFIFKIGLVTIVGTLAAFSGALVLLYQLVIGFKESTEVDKDLNKPSVELLPSSSGYTWQTVASVFVAWFFTQIVIGVIFFLLQQKGLSLESSQTNSLASAVSIALVYLVSNGPALLYIYFMALRPNGQKFLEGINLRLKVGNHGMISLITIGVFAWAAAIPLVIGAYFVSATFFGSGGSGSPIIAIVMDAAQGNNVLAIMLFYFTLGVLAPLCEESLFRGFFYANLRTRYGVIASNLISSSLFAIAHMDIGAVLPLFCLGSMFAYVYERTKSILPSMIAHGLWNSATFTVVLLLFGG